MARYGQAFNLGGSRTWDRRLQFGRSGPFLAGSLPHSYGLWGCKSDKNCPRWGQISLRRPKPDSLMRNKTFHIVGSPEFGRFSANAGRPQGAWDAPRQRNPARWSGNTRDATRGYALAEMNDQRQRIVEAFQQLMHRLRLVTGTWTASRPPHSPASRSDIDESAIAENQDTPKGAHALARLPDTRRSGHPCPGT